MSVGLCSDFWVRKFSKLRWHDGAVVIMGHTAAEVKEA
jgi:hypothetical protein